MKIKSLALILASAALLGACNAGPSSQSVSSEQSSQAESSSSISKLDMLDFIEQGKVYFDVHDIDVKITYGNAVIRANGANKIDLNDSATLAVEGTSTQLYNFLYVFQVGDSQYGQSINMGIEGESLAEFLELRKDALKGKTRAFVAISTGKPASWTHGLNTKLDEELTVWTKTDTSVE